MSTSMRTGKTRPTAGPTGAITSHSSSSPRSACCDVSANIGRRHVCVCMCAPCLISYPCMHRVRACVACVHACACACLLGQQALTRVAVLLTHVPPRRQSSTPFNADTLIAGPKPPMIPSVHACEHVRLSHGRSHGRTDALTLACTHACSLVWHSPRHTRPLATAHSATRPRHRCTAQRLRCRHANEPAVRYVAHPPDLSARRHTSTHACMHTRL